MRAKRICANTFPDTDKREIGLLSVAENSLDYDVHDKQYRCSNVHPFISLSALVTHSAHRSQRSHSGGSIDFRIAGVRKPRATAVLF